MHLFSKKKIIILLLLPTLIIYTGYIILPIFISFYYSLTDYQGILTPNFIGLENYFKIFQDELFINAIKNTFIILVIAFVILIPASFGLAILLNEKFKGMSIFKALTFAPNIIAPIISGLIFVFVLDPEIGLINNLLDLFGLSMLKAKWIGGEKLTPYSVGIVYTWQVIGFNAAIFLAGLKMIPKELYEAAKIDGANSREILRYITIPAMHETNIINIVLVITGVFKVFELIIQLTNGGPNHLSHVLTTYMYHTTFRVGNYGKGMAMAVVSFVFSIGITLILLKVRSRKEVDDA